MNDVYDMYFRTSNRIKAKIVVYNQHPISSTDDSLIGRQCPHCGKIFQTVQGFQNPVCDTLSCPWTYFRSMNQGNLTQFISCLSQEDDPIPRHRYPPILPLPHPTDMWVHHQGDFALPSAASPAVSILLHACRALDKPTILSYSLRKVVDDLISILTPLSIDNSYIYFNLIIP